MANLTGSTTAVFFVSLSAAVDEIVDVDWNTRDGTAIAGKDYEATSGTVSFLPGETEKAIDVIVYGQDDASADGKKFYIELKPPANAVLTDALAECVITVADEDGVLVTSLVIAQGKRGLKGNPGLSAYEQAVLMGYTGTVEEWMQEEASASAAATRAESYAADAAGSVAEAALISSNLDVSANAAIAQVNEVASTVSSLNNSQEYFLTQTELLAAKPTVSKKAAKALDTKKVFMWTRTSSEGVTPVTGTWTDTGLSEFDQAKNYIDLKTVLDGTNNLIQFLSSNGSTLLLMTKRRKLYIAGIKGALQDVIAGILSKTDRIITDTLKNSLFSVKDNANNTRLILSAKNNVFCNDVVTKKTSISDLHKRLLEQEKAIKAMSLKNVDQVLAITKNEPAQLAETTIFLEDSVEGRLQLFSPVVVRIAKDKYLIFCESRTGGDFGDISIVYKIVTVNNDYSLTVSDYEVLADNENIGNVGFDCYNTCAIKTQSGRIIVYYTKRFKDNETFTSLDFCCKTSDDDGATWSAERVLNDQFQDYATRRFVLAGPGKAIQLKHGKYKGRIVVPCYGAMDGSYPVSSAGQMRSFLLLSDDNGQTYKLGASSTIYSSNECSVAETVEGDIVFLTRNGTNYKTVELSSDGGLTSKNTKILKDPLVAVCQVGFAQAENSYDLQIPKLLMTAPADTLRRDLTLYLSYDNGQTFERKKQLMSGTASYSDVDVIDDTHIFAVYAFNNRRISGIVVNLKTVYGA